MNPLPPKWLARGYLALFVLLPWSVEVSFGHWALLVPAEPLLAILGVGLVVICWREWRLAFASFLKNRLFLLTAFWMLWQTTAAAWSTMPIVSWKYILVETGQWWVLAAGITLWPMLWRKVMPIFALSMAGVVVYTIVHHAGYHFRADQALLSPMPFFPDHTLYAAVLAATLVLVWQLPFEQFAPWWKVKPSVTALLVATTAAVALALAHSRAATLSLFVALAIGVVVISWKKNRRWLVFLGLVVLGAGFFFLKEVATKTSAYLHADASSAERLNRYACASRMARDRPWSGFGPGTFPFQYLAYQQPAEMTRISITSPIAERGPSNYGRGGGAHSECWQTLAETGWPGLLLWLGWAIGACLMGVQHFFQEKNRGKRWLYLALVLSLLTFFLHGLVNNFLHDARMAALVWGSVIMLGHSSIRQVDQR